MSFNLHSLSDTASLADYKDKPLFFTLMRQKNSKGELPIDTWINTKKWHLVIEAFELKQLAYDMLSDAAICKILSHFKLAEIKLEEFQENATLYKLITAWLYKANRRLSLNQKSIVQLGTLQVDSSDTAFFVLTKLLCLYPNTSFYTYESLSQYLTTIETQTNDFYGSYLSDDSDSEEEEQYQKKTPQEKERLRAQAKLMLARNEHVLFFDGNSPQKALRIGTPASKRTVSGKEINPFDERRRIHQYPSDQAKQDLLLINSRIEEGMSLAQASKDITTPFFIAQYRGIHYRTSEFNQTARRKFREESKRNKPIYSLAVHEKAGSYPFHRFYKLPADAQRATSKNLPEISKTMQANILKLRRNTPFTWNGYTYNSWFDFIQDQYSKDLKSFEANLAVNYFDFTGIHLNAKKNIMVSTGNYPLHPLEYAYGYKYYQGPEEKAERLRPRWRSNGRAERMWVGEVYTHYIRSQTFQLPAPQMFLF